MIGVEKILVVEDERLIRMTLRERLQGAGYEVTDADCGASAFEALESEDIDLMLLDYRLPDTDGMAILRRTLEEYPDISVIMMTAFSTVDSAVEALKLGAYDYVKKPIDHGSLLATIRKALEQTRLRREVRRLRDEQRLRGGVAIVGRSTVMQEVLALVRKVAAASTSTVLIEGASGTGKDLVAKAIHFGSARADKPLMNVTCSAIPESLLESELFGYERGSFTDAKQQKKGLLEQADGGSLFLDEVGDMGAAPQAALLRFLEEKSFKRVGGDRDIHVDVRVIAATNRDLERAVHEGRFREDLFYRLNVIPIVLPPLRERKDDIPLLVDHFVDQFNREFKKNTRRVSPGALRCLIGYDWPGNVRELRNVIERAMILENKEALNVTDLPQETVHYHWSEDRPRLEGAAASADDAPANGLAGVVVALPETGVSLRAVERNLLCQALDRTHGNQSQAARLLRISRDALRYKVKKFGLH